jgi:hypothetical protein
LGGQLHFRGSCRTGYLEHMLDESGLSCCHSPHRHCLSTFVAVTKFRGNVVPTYRISTIVFLHLEKCGFGVCSHVRRVWTSFDRPKLELVARLSSACQLLIYREAMSSHKTRTGNQCQTDLGPIESAILRPAAGLAPRQHRACQIGRRWGGRSCWNI